MLEVCDGLQEVFLAKVGPKNWGEEEFGVGDLPEEEVGNAEVATGANEEVGVRYGRGGEVGGDGGGGDVIGIEGSALGVNGDTTEGIGYLPPSGVAERKYECESRASSGVGDTLVKSGADGFRHARKVANDSEADTILEHGGRFVFNAGDEEVHERMDFGGRSVPVFGGEGVEGEVADAHFSGGGDGVTHGGDGVFVSFGTIETAPEGPTSVAVHDDGDMSRQVAVHERK